ncbi:MAG: hypothetical protein LQ350_006987 [Teloschistes chrysophthalmus]|nr:MAG: hypothetical protein LQ350_006987 [Niorma chrysophthalma]
MAKATMNMLQYLQSRTQVDFDNLDVEASKRLGPFVDCTSNQMDAYNELINPHRAGLIKKAAALANEIHKYYPEVPQEELAYEIAMVSCAQTILPSITGCLLVMANPRYAYSTPKTVDNGRRIYQLSTRLDPTFDTSRLIVKVASTWEGLQACRTLKTYGVKTLATTAFSLEQCILAAEAGCVYVSPFLNELKAALDPDYHDDNPIFDIVVDAQHYYRQHNYPIRMKACAALSVDQILKLAGVDAFTAPADQLQELANMEGPPPQSLFSDEPVDEKSEGKVDGAVDGHANGETNGHTNGAANGHANGETNGAANGHASNGHGKKQFEKQSFIDDESGYRLAFAKADDGKGQMKTTQASRSSPAPDLRIWLLGFP